MLVKKSTFRSLQLELEEARKLYNDLCEKREAFEGNPRLEAFARLQRSKSQAHFDLSDIPSSDLVKELEIRNLIPEVGDRFNYHGFDAVVTSADRKEVFFEYLRDGFVESSKISLSHYAAL